MAQYTAIFTKPYEDGYEDLPSQNTPITAQTLNDKDAAIEHIEGFLDGNEFPTSLSDLSEDETHRLVTDTEKAAWNGAVNDIDYYEQNGFLSRNIWDEQWESGIISIQNGNPQGYSGYLRSKNFIPIEPGKTYCINLPNADGGVIFYGSDKSYVSGDYYNRVAPAPNRTFTAPNTAYYLKFYNNGSTYGKNICINLSDPTFDFKYTPYAPSNNALNSKKADITAIGTDESGRTTASKAYAQGDIFYKDGFIGEALTAVASGATWTLNTNYKQTTLAEIVAALRA